jgi:hypothetical protein
MSLPEAICIMHPRFPAAITSGVLRGECGDLAALQFGGKVRLEQVVGSGRPAAKVAVGGFHDLETQPSSAESFGADLIFCPCCSEHAA